MPLSIKDPEADQLARKLAQRTGETITQALITALRERLARERRTDEAIESLIEEIMDIGRHCAYGFTRGGIGVRLAGIELRAGVECIDENDGGPGVRLRKGRQKHK